MSPGRMMFVGIASMIFSTLTQTPAARAEAAAPEEVSLGDVSIENGGVIILHTISQVCPDTCAYGATVLVATDAEIAALHLHFEREAAIEMIIRIQDGSTQAVYSARVQCTDDERLSGHFLTNGAAVVVVGESYARRHGWLN